MAGDWIKVEHVTPDKPEVHRIAEILHMDPDMVVGKLVRLWIWADQQTADGDMPIASPKLIDRVVNHAGFADALMTPDVTWLSRDVTKVSRDVTTGDKTCHENVTNGRGLCFPHFERHMSQSAKSRALTANRVADYRSRDVPVTDVALQRRDSTEKRREYVSSTVVCHDKKVSRNVVREKTIDLMRQMFNRPPTAPMTEEACKMFGWAVVAKVFTESDSASIIDSMKAPGIKQRGRYLRACVRKRLEANGVSWDTAAAELQSTV